ncbi:MAG TPA: monofunctional biosynthetic peptidoglycan transglycosylase [Blastocatellia bacterium]|nr:monofunctional biosynthetic peptidoglycan transglycosylase [Blastocatellia bacterium]
MAQVRTAQRPRTRIVKRRTDRPVLRWIFAIGALVLGAGILYHSFILIQIFRFKHVNPAETSLMKQREGESEAKGLLVRHDQIWVPYNRISPSLIRAVLAGEDSRFFDHSGFDWEEMEKAAKKDWEEKGFKRGASTISQQLAKNLFLSTSKNPLRKLHEALITWELERVLGKRRILELYLNVIEWGDGIYGAESASRYYFGCSAASLGPDQAAFLAAIIPNPRDTFNPKLHRGRVDRRQNLIIRLMRHVVIPRDLS